MLWREVLLPIDLILIYQRVARNTYALEIKIVGLADGTSVSVERQGIMLRKCQFIEGIHPFKIRIYDLYRIFLQKNRIVDNCI